VAGQVTRGRGAALRAVAVMLVGAALLASSAPGAAQTRVPRIGVLVFRPQSLSPFPNYFPAALRAAGYVDGETVHADVRYAEGREDRAAALAAELVRSNVDVMVAIDTPAARAAKNATSTIPIVIAAGDPVGTGLVTSLARPGGNITGVTGNTAAAAAKGLQLFRQLVPRATRFGLVLHAADPFTRSLLTQTQHAADTLGPSTVT
jgi:putative tryptophan/tyrosine transport system substrate-binding protein